MPLRATARRLLSRIRGAGGAPGAGSIEPRDGATIGDVDWRTLAPEAPIAFRCNLCGSGARSPLSALARETPSCPRCGSTVRFRSIADLDVHELTG